MATIPRILHQTWSSSELPPLFQRCRAEWLRLHPTWDHRFYDDEACREVARSMGQLGLYDAMTTAIQRADLFRYLVVLRDGGVYADLDMECLRPIDRLLEGASCLLSVEAHLTSWRRRELGYAGSVQLANCIFAAAPGEAIFERLVDAIAQRAQCNRLAVHCDADVEDSTGPRLLTRCYELLTEREREGIRVLPQIALMAPRELPRLARFGPPIFARHLCAGTWKRDRTSRSLWRWLVERNKIPPLWPKLQP